MFLVSFLTCLVGLVSEETRPQIEAKEDRTRVVVRVMIPEAARARLPQGVIPQAEGNQWLKFVLVRQGKVGPSMFGTYTRRGTTLTFRPAVGLERGFRYRAIYTPNELSQSYKDYVVPLVKKTKPTKIVKVYPTANVLPANHLRFYIHFSGPMRGGEEIFRQIQILDAKGKAVHDPWLHDELWDQKDKKLILYIHPGRIKWNVFLRQQLGPVLVANTSYTFLIRTVMLDANGKKLAKEYRKTFRTSVENRHRVDLSKWKVAGPQVNTKTPIRVTFPVAIDYSSLHRFLHIVDSKNRKVNGTITIGKDERSWLFSPTKEWGSQRYRLVVDPRLEDTAGNTPLRPFDRDLKKPLPPPQRLTVPFRAR
ncbi:MAG: Ig-like domain-containing protein [Gemmataceae bacterium]